MTTRWAERARLDFGVGLTVIASALTLVFALTAPYVLNLFWQIADGREILRGHFPATVAYAIDAGPLIHQQWLFEVALAWAALHHGYGLFVLVCAAAACATPVLAYLLVRSVGGSDLAAGIVAVLTLGGRFVGSAIRPETFAVDLFALELLVLTRPRWRWWILVIEVVWANVHASAILGPLAIGVYTCGDALLQRRASAQTRSLLALTLAAFLATALTPDGVRLWGYTSAMTVAPSELRATLDAWRP
jgi:hypothetical protein